MKKLRHLTITAMLVVTLAFTGQAALGAFAWIGDRYETDELAFAAIMDEIGDEMGFYYDTYTYERTALYNTEEELSGYVYDFKLDGMRDGFVLMVKQEYGGQTWYEVTEIYEGVSLFFQKSGVNMYPTFRTYINYDNDVYIDMGLDLVITYEIVLALEEKGFGFNGGLSWSNWSETISYSTRTIQKDMVDKESMPTLLYGSNNPSTCAVVTGNNIINYWAYYKPDLIPGVDVYSLFLGVIFSWKGDRNEIKWVPEELYVMMGTNTTGSGTTVAQFKNGITEFADTYGNYGVTYRSVMSSGQYNMSKMLTQFAANRPVALFCNPYFNIVGAIDVHSGYDLISNSDYTGSHAMVSCGRQIYEWRDSSGNIVKNITFLKISTGMSYAPSGWMRLDTGHFDINDAFSVEIT